MRCVLIWALQRWQGSGRARVGMQHIRALMCMSRPVHANCSSAGISLTCSQLPSAVAYSPVHHPLRHSLMQLVANDGSSPSQSYENEPKSDVTLLQQGRKGRRVRLCCRCQTVQAGPPAAAGSHSPLNAGACRAQTKLLPALHAGAVIWGAGLAAGGARGQFPHVGSIPGILWVGHAGLGPGHACSSEEVRPECFRCCNMV